jgi:hypothetical protein
LFFAPYSLRLTPCGILRAAQKDLLAAKDLDDLKATFKKWRRIGWKNVCRLWLQERTPEQLKVEGGDHFGEMG